ncbi:Uncharacterised protein [Mycoplasmopsis maculosa]|uniref:Uncharacterized protein n=1 Tax=Mycoplasmopsis maculosa TaxID=114885 RepID=A0A449B3K5_9BACT|nr:hypothetical protein [Mycoplasmopsis maculosa]VEU75184.1 Uncharacterised protein [Mycoplasmopsis maculosa]
MLRLKYNKQLNLNLNISRIENKTEKEIISDLKLSFPVELLKFLILVFVSSFFIMLQYNNLLQTPNDILRQIYLYSFGLVFGDSLILILIGSYLSLIIRWCSPFFKNKYFTWFRNYIKVDYWTVRYNVIIFLWMNILAIALIYHSVLMFFRVDLSTTILKTEDLKNIFTNGWISSFTRNWTIYEKNSNLLPNASLNIGVYLDSIFNLLYFISFSPYLAWFVVIFLIVYSWILLIFVKPKLFFNRIFGKKSNIFNVEKILGSGHSPFYLTKNIKVLFEFYKKAGEYLNLDLSRISFKNLLLSIYSNDSLLNEKYLFEVKLEKNKIKNEDPFSEEILYEENFTKENSIFELKMQDNENKIIKTNENISVIQEKKIDEKINFLEDQSNDDEKETNLVKIDLKKIEDENTFLIDTIEISKNDLANKNETESLGFEIDTIEINNEEPLVEKVVLEDNNDNDWLSPIL